MREVEKDKYPDLILSVSGYIGSPSGALLEPEALTPTHIRLTY
jgi:hypothetical protein